MRECQSCPSTELKGRELFCDDCARKRANAQRFQQVSPQAISQQIRELREMEVPMRTDRFVDFLIAKVSL